MAPDEKRRALQRLHALMAHTVANGCTPDEELSAARMAGRLAEEIMGDEANEGVEQDNSHLRPAERLRAERESDDYKEALKRNTLEGIFKLAIQELSMNHINLVAPPGRRLSGHKTASLDVRALLNSHLGMVFGVANVRSARQVLADTIEELMQDGMLPERLAVPTE